MMEKAGHVLTNHMEQVAWLRRLTTMVEEKCENEAPMTEAEDERLAGSLLEAVRAAGKVHNIAETALIRESNKAGKASKNEMRRTEENQFVDFVRGIIIDNTTVSPAGNAVEQAMFTLMAALDGCTEGMPGYYLIAVREADDDEEVMLPDRDISGSLHDQL